MEKVDEDRKNINDKSENFISNKGEENEGNDSEEIEEYSEDLRILNKKI